MDSETERVRKFEPIEKKKGRAKRDGESPKWDTRGELFFPVFFCEHVLVQRATKRPLRCGRTNSCDRRWAEERGKSHSEKGYGDRENEERGVKIEKANLSVGDWATVRLDRRWSRNAIFSRIELLIAKVEHQNDRLRRDAIHFPIWLLGIKRQFVPRDP